MNSVRVIELNRASARKMCVEENGVTIGRIYLYILYNDLHEEPFGFLEDLFVEEAWRNRGVGRDLVERAIVEAKAAGCYKLILTSRHGKKELHEWYVKLGFRDHGAEFRLTFI